MKGYIIVICLLSFALVGCDKKDDSNQQKEESLSIKDKDRYELFQTTNMWTFLKLDTQTGKIWQVQYSINDDNRGEVPVNSLELVSSNSSSNGRFTLYPTQNMYNFILLDQYDGKMWQVQWSMEEETRGIIPLNH